MLKVASFKITDEDGINALLSTQRVPSDGKILVSNGEICIFYEDGSPISKETRIISCREQINVMVQQLDLIEQSQRVNVVACADLKDKFNFAKAAWDKARSNKALEAAKNVAEGAVVETENLIARNDAEIGRIKLNIEKFEEQIAAITE
jgi:hypothetical protein